MNLLSPFRYIMSKSLDGLHFFRSIVTTFVHVLFSLSLPLSGPSTYIIKLFLINIVVDLHWTCPNHLKRVSLTLSSIGATPKCSQKHSFLIFIHPSFTTHPPRHYLTTSFFWNTTFSHYYTHFMHVLLLDWLAFYFICHSWSNHCHVKFFLQSCWYVPITKHSKSKSPLQPSCFYPISDVFLNLSTLTNYWANVSE